MKKWSMLTVVSYLTVLGMFAGQANASYFWDDFEDDTIGSAPIVSGSNVGGGYSTATGLIQVLANPDSNAGSGNESALVLGYDGGNAVLINHLIGYYTSTVQIDGLTVSYDFYGTSTGVNTNDSVRSSLVGEADATDVWMRNDRDGLIKLDGNDQTVSNYGGNVWQNFTATFTQTAAGNYDLAWTVTNLVTGESVNGTQAVLSAFDNAGGIILEVFEGQSPVTNVYSGYIDNMMVTPEPATLLVLGVGGLFLRRRR